MTTSELTAALNRVQQIVGDVDVAFQVESSTGTPTITDIVVHLDPAGTPADSLVTIVIGDAPAPVPTPPDPGSPPPAEPAA